MSEFKGTVYIICFSRNFKRARHYVGFAVSVKKRLAHHLAGTGSKLLAAVKAAGIDFKIVREFKHASREIEREIKNHKKAADFCPECAERLSKRLLTPKTAGTSSAMPKRSYKWESGELPHVSAITVTPANLYPKLARRVRVGEKIQVDQKVLIRQDRRKTRNYFSEYYEQIEIGDVIDEASTMTPEKYQALIDRAGSKEYKNLIQGTWENDPVFYDLNNSADLDKRPRNVCVCGHSIDWHDLPNGGDETGRAPCDYTDDDGRGCYCADYQDEYDQDDGDDRPPVEIYLFGDDPGDI